MKSFRWLAVVLLLASCATTNRWERLTSDESLVLIPTVYSNTDGAPDGRAFRLLFETKGGQPLSEPVSLKGFDFVAVKMNESISVSLIGAWSTVEGQNVTGRPAAAQFRPIALPNLPGSVTVADFTFVHTIKRISSDTFSSNFEVIETSAEQKSKELALFQKSSSSAGWDGTY